MKMDLVQVGLAGLGFGLAVAALVACAVGAALRGQPLVERLLRIMHWRSQWRARRVLRLGCFAAAALGIAALRAVPHGASEFFVAFVAACALAALLEIAVTATLAFLQDKTHGAWS